MEIFCSYCEKPVEKPDSEVRRSKKLGRRMFCSLACCGRANIGNLPKPTAKTADHLPKGREVDEYSPFRQHLIMARRRKKSATFELTLEDLKQQWERQDGRCPYTGWKLKNLSSTQEWNRPHESSPDSASLDRIDSSIGYEKGNIEFVSVMANYAKHTFGKEDLLRFCRAVVDHQEHSPAPLERA